MLSNKPAPLFGIGYRPDHYGWVLEHKPKVDWFEIISENFMSVGGRPRRYLEQLRSLYPVGMHGVSLSIGSPEPVRKNYLTELKELIQWLDPIVVSDHLCWTRFGAHNTHDLLPLPYTSETLRFVVGKINQVQDFIGRSLLLENASMYVCHKNNEMTEAEFLRELCTQTGCKVLLDLNNLSVNQHNLGWNPVPYFELLSSEMVGQFHLAGHLVLPDVRIDTHDHPVNDEVLKLYGLATQRWPHVPTLIEWDAQIPEFPVLLQESEKAKAHHCFGVSREQNHPATLLATSSNQHPALTTNPEELQSIQKKFYTMMVDPEGVTSETQNLEIFSHTAPVERERGMRVYNDAYFLRIRDCLRDTFPTLLYVMEEDGFDQTAALYLEHSPPKKDSIKYVGENLESFIRSVSLPTDFGVSQNILADIAALDWARFDLFDHPDRSLPLQPEFLQKLSAQDWETARFNLIPAHKILSLNSQILPVWQAAHDQKEPETPVTAPCTVLVWRQGESIRHQALTPQHAEWLKQIALDTSFQESITRILGNDETAIHEGAKFLGHAVQSGLIKSRT